MFHVKHQKKLNMDLKIKDFFFSKEEFELKEVKNGILETQNIPKDLDRYYNSENYISHTNSKKGIKEILYSIVQKQNLKYKLKLIQKYCTGKSILDYGCGNGVFLDYMKNNNFKIQGFEPSEAGKIETEKLLGITLKKNIDDLEKTDCITLWHVLEHIPNPEEILIKLSEKLNPNGKIIIAIPNYESYDAKYYKEFWAAFDVPRHLFHYSKRGALSFFNDYFKIETTAPLLFDSYYISILSENYKGNSLALFKGFINGFKSNQNAKKDGNYSSVIYVLSKK